MFAIWWQTLLYDDFGRRLITTGSWLHKESMRVGIRDESQDESQDETGFLLCFTTWERGGSRKRSRSMHLPADHSSLSRSSAQFGNEKVWSHGMPWSVHAKCNGIFVREKGEDSQDNSYGMRSARCFSPQSFSGFAKSARIQLLTWATQSSSTVQWLKLRPFGKVFWNKQNLSKSNHTASTTFNN